MIGRLGHLTVPLTSTEAENSTEKPNERHEKTPLQILLQCLGLSFSAHVHEWKADFLCLLQRRAPVDHFFFVCVCAYAAWPLVLVYMCSSAIPSYLGDKPPALCVTGLALQLTD